uniref:Ig-like domain-containing protein n=1 Tax=Pelusios castaneus TaxID=367368 RepID=A0A8C8SBI2_9SAUR
MTNPYKAPLLPLAWSLVCPSLCLPPALPQPVVPSTVVEMHKDSALVCCVSGFYPQDIRVSWLQDGQNLKATFITDTRQEHKKETFSLVAVYRFTPTAQDLGALFSCQAWHPLLNQSRQADVYISFSGEGETICATQGGRVPTVCPAQGLPSLPQGTE